MKPVNKYIVQPINKYIVKPVVKFVNKAVTWVGNKFNGAKQVASNLWNGVTSFARNSYNTARNYVSGRVTYGPPYYGGSGSSNYLNVSGSPRSYSNMTYAQQVAAQTAYRQQQLTLQYQKATGSKGKPKTKEGQNLLKNWGTALKNTLTKFCKTAPKVAKKVLQTGVSFGVGVVAQLGENTGIFPVLNSIFGEWTPKDWIAQNPGYSKGRQFGNIFGLAQAAAEYASAAAVFTGGNGLSLAGAPATGGASLALSPGATALSGAIVQHATGVLASSIQNMMGGNNGGSGNKTELKTVGSNKNANKVAKEAGYKDAHDFKEAFVGKKNVAKFDIKYNKKTGEIFLENKNGKIQIPTGYYK